MEGACLQPATTHAHGRGTNLALSTGPLTTLSHKLQHTCSRKHTHGTRDRTIGACAVVMPLLVDAACGGDNTGHLAQAFEAVQADSRVPCGGAGCRVRQDGFGVGDTERCVLARGCKVAGGQGWGWWMVVVVVVVGDATAPI